MRDRTFSAHHVIALGLWLIGLGLIAAGFVYSAPSLGQLGLLSAGCGGVVNIRGFFCASSRREREMFELGQDAARLRSIH